MTQIAVGVAPVQAAPRNAKRMSLSFYNKSAGGQVIDLSKAGPQGLTTGNSEYVLAAGAGINFMIMLDGIDIRNEWGAIASAAGGVLVVGETAER